MKQPSDIKSRHEAQPANGEGSSGSASYLTSGRLLAHNTIWNVLGLLSPMVVAVVTIPPLIKGLGLARFGVLSLAWVVIGYFSLFDLGIGRALTKLIADKLGADEEASIPPLAWTSLLLLFLMGLLGGAITWVVSPWLIKRALHIPEALQTETLHGFYLLASSIPIVTVTSGLRGILEAQQRFRILNLIRIPTSIFSFAGPLLVLPFSNSLVAVIAVLVVGRILGAFAHLFACFYSMPALRHNFVVRRSISMPLVKLGGWMTVSNLAAPIIVYIDRFLISALLSVGAVAYYTAPFDIVNRLLVVPGAVAIVLFPAFAVSMVQDQERTAVLLSRGVKYVLLAVFPVVLLLAAFAPEGLRIWLGPAFAVNGSPVLRWLAAGVLISSISQIPFSLIQGSGRAHITAAFQLAELPVYLLALRFLVRSYGLEGAAIAWTARVALDAILLFLYSYFRLPHRPRFLFQLSLAMTAALLAVYAVAIPESLLLRAALVIGFLIFFAILSWLRALSAGERAFVRGRVGRGGQSEAPGLRDVALSTGPESK